MVSLYVQNAWVKFYKAVLKAENTAKIISVLSKKMSGATSHNNVKFVECWLDTRLVPCLYPQG